MFLNIFRHLAKSVTSRKSSTSDARRQKITAMFTVETDACNSFAAAKANADYINYSTLVPSLIDLSKSALALGAAGRRPGRLGRRSRVSVSRRGSRSSELPWPREAALLALGRGAVARRRGAPAQGGRGQRLLAARLGLGRRVLGRARHLLLFGSV